MPIRTLAALLGLFHAANGLYMLAAPQAWFGLAPGAAAQGHSDHLPTDLGIIAVPAFLGLAVAWPRKGDIRAQVPRWTSA